MKYGNSWKLITENKSNETKQKIQTIPMNISATGKKKNKEGSNAGMA